MSSNIVTITRFPLPEGITSDQLKAGFDEVAPAFAKIPGLIQKTFLVSQDGTQAGGSYLWEDEEHARNFSDTQLKNMIRERFGVECQIEYFSALITIRGEHATEA